MKTLGEYINANFGDEAFLKKIEESAFDYDYDIDDESINEGLGNILGNIAGKFSNFLRKIKGFGPKVGNVMTITAKSITSIDSDEEQQKAKDLIASYDNCKDTDDIIKVNVKYLKDNPDTKSKFNTGLITSTILMIRKSKKEESKQYEKELTDMLAKQDEVIKKDLKKDMDKLDKETPKSEEPQKKGEGNETPETKEEAEKKVEEVTSKDIIEPLTKAAGINVKQLRQVVTGMIIDDNGKLYDLNDFDNAVTGLCAIISGVQLIKNEDVANNILTACGIDYKEFKEKLKTALENVK